MLKQNYLNVFINQAGNVTIASGIHDEKPDSDIEVESIQVSPLDLVTIADALNQIAIDLDEEDRHA